MRTVKLFYNGIILIILSGCSSAPEPAQPEWSKPDTAVNTTLPRWSENRVIIPSNEIDDHWTTTINLNPANIYPPNVWYAVAHSNKIIVNAPNAEKYFIAKSWLRKHGYTGVVTFLSKLNDCLTCNTTEIAFYR